MKPFSTLSALLLSLATAAAEPQISVSGSAEVKVVPDEIRISVAVETRAVTLDRARVENDQKIAATLAFLKQSGVVDRDVKTGFISVQPEYDNHVSVKPEAYVVRKGIEIRLTKIDDFQNLLTGLLTNGVNVVENVDFRTTQLRKYRDEARAMAARAAREKAKALTGELGSKLGKPITINAEDTPVWGGWYRNGFNGFNNASQNVSVNNTPVSDESNDTFAAGQISVSATVNVSFAIE